MADHSKTLDDVFTEARQEPPVVTLDEVRTLLADRRIGALSTRINWRRYAMLGLILATASVITLFIGTQPVQRGVHRQAPLAVSAPQTPSVAPSQPERDHLREHTSTSAVHDNGRTSGTNDTRGVARKTDTVPTPGEEPWGYRFARGQKLRYRFVSEFSQPDIGEWFTNTLIVDIFVESVEDDGRATLVMSVALDSMDYKSKPVLPDGIEILRGKKPEIVRAIVSRFGKVLEGEIVRDTRMDALKKGGSNALRQTPDVTLVENYLDNIFTKLPEATSLRSTRSHRDTVTGSYEIPSIGPDMKVTMQTIYDTTRAHYTVIGPRKSRSGAYDVLTINSVKTNGRDGGEIGTTYSTMVEVHMRASDGIPTRAVTTMTSHSANTGTSLRATLDLIGEDWVGANAPPAFETPEELD